MLHLCPKCKRKKRAAQVLKTINKKKWWAYVCVDCKTIMDLEEVEDKKAKRK